MSDTLKEGWLVKEGEKFKSFKKRYFRLRNGHLYCHKSPEAPETSVVRLEHETEVVPVEKKSRKFCIEIRTPGQRSYFFDAESEKERNAWIDVLKKVISKKTAHKVGLDDFKLLKVIGQGSFGKVMQVVKKDSGQIYAMKILNKKTIVERHDEEHVRAERRILQRLDHPFLVNLHFSFQTPDKLYFVMDYVNGGELFHHMQQVDNFDETRTRFYVAEIGLGLDYLHSQGVLYRDLKPENVLISKKGHICLTDFGISKEGLDTDDAKTATFVGTPEYLAPEILEGKKYGKAVDWWSLGTLMYEMLAGLPPFYAEDVQEMYQRILKQPISFPSNISGEAKSVLSKLLERDPEKRLRSLEEFRGQKFFQGLDFDKLVNGELEPPYKPPVKDEKSTSMIASDFTNQKAVVESEDFAQNFDDFTYNSKQKK